MLKVIFKVIFNPPNVAGGGGGGGGGGGEGIMTCTGVGCV